MSILLTQETKFMLQNAVDFIEKYELKDDSEYNIEDSNTNYQEFSTFVRSCRSDELKTLYDCMQKHYEKSETQIICGWRGGDAEQTLNNQRDEFKKAIKKYAYQLQFMKIFLDNDAFVSMQENASVNTSEFEILKFAQKLCHGFPVDVMFNIGDKNPGEAVKDQITVEDACELFFSEDEDGKYRPIIDFKNTLKTSVDDILGKHPRIKSEIDSAQQKEEMLKKKALLTTERASIQKKYLEVFSEKCSEVAEQWYKDNLLQKERELITTQNSALTQAIKQYNDSKERYDAILNNMLETMEGDGKITQEQKEIIDKEIIDFYKDDLDEYLDILNDYAIIISDKSDLAPEDMEKQINAFNALKEKCDENPEYKGAHDAFKTNKKNLYTHNENLKKLEEGSFIKKSKDIVLEILQKDKDILKKFPVAFDQIGSEILRSDTNTLKAFNDIIYRQKLHNKILEKLKQDTAIGLNNSINKKAEIEFIRLVIEEELKQSSAFDITKDDIHNIKSFGVQEKMIDQYKACITPADKRKFYKSISCFQQMENINKVIDPYNLIDPYNHKTLINDFSCTLQETLEGYKTALNIKLNNTITNLEIDKQIIDKIDKINQQIISVNTQLSELGPQSNGQLITRLEITKDQRDAEKQRLREVAANTNAAQDFQWKRILIEKICECFAKIAKMFKNMSRYCIGNQNQNNHHQR